MTLKRGPIRAVKADAAAQQRVRVIRPPPAAKRQPLRPTRSAARGTARGRGQRGAPKIGHRPTIGRSRGLNCEATCRDRHATLQVARLIS